MCMEYLETNGKSYIGNGLQRETDKKGEYLESRKRHQQSVLKDSGSTCKNSESNLSMRTSPRISISLRENTRSCRQKVSTRAGGRKSFSEIGEKFLTKKIRKKVSLRWPRDNKGSIMKEA